jgi:phosphoribosylanthranilate isomerase
MLKTLVKASSITNLTDARYFAAWEVKWLGFCLDPGASEFVSPEQFLAFREWVDSVELVGEFGDQDWPFIAETLRQLPLDAIQIAHPLPPARPPDISTTPLIQEMILAEDTTADQLRGQLVSFGPNVSYFLLDFVRNGLSWEAIREEGSLLPVGELRSLCNEFPILLAFDWTPENLEDILFHLHPMGISVQGGDEEKVGVKSFEQLDALFELLQVED